nr:hypothetical protein CFP56_29244 [Quercus suber]
MVVSSTSFLSKVVDDPTDWTARPYSTLEGRLPSLFTSLESVTVSRYRDTPWFAHQFGFDQGVLGQLSTLALPAVVATLGFKKENLIKILVSSPKIPFTSPTRAGLPSPRFKSWWSNIREHVRNFGESDAQWVDVPPIFQGNLILKLPTKAKLSSTRRKKSTKVSSVKKPQSNGKEDCLALPLDDFLSTLSEAEGLSINVSWLKSHVTALRDLKKVVSSIHASLSSLRELRDKESSCINKAKDTESALEVHGTLITQLQESIKRLQVELTSKQEASSALQAQLEGVTVERSSLSQKIEKLEGELGALSHPDFSFETSVLS